MSVTPAGGPWLPPSRADLFAWLGAVDSGTGGDVYDLALSVATERQAQACSWEEYTSALHAAALRRAARFLAAKALALGRLDLGEFGATFIPQWDAEIEDYESAYRNIPVA